MTGPMRRIALSSMVVVGILAGWLTFQQVLAGSVYADDPRNVRALPDPGETERGIITTADGVVVAEDTATGRSYPRRGDYLHLVGYVASDGSSGLERTRAPDLRSIDDGSITSWLLGLFGASLEPPEVRLTVVDAVQQAGIEGLAGRRGAVVALDPASGAILAYVSSPTADPNDLGGGDVSVSDFVESSESLDRVAFRVLPPGSTFKTLISAAALESAMTPDTVFEDLVEYLAPGAGAPIGNASGGSCVDGDEITLREALVVSCNTVFAPLAVDLGGEAVNDIAERAGFNSVLPFELGAAISSIPTGDELSADPAALAQTGIGERDVRVTPLQMAVLTGGIANGGMMMEPHVVDRVLTRDGSTLSKTRSKELGRIFTGDVAADLVSMMIDVVTDGTGRAASLPDVTVAGKTGTAEGAAGNHAWFIGFAPAEDPSIVVVVVVEEGGSGGAVAAPIARTVLEAYLTNST
jgi:peptidoglycan glycosyltransferase